METLRLDGSTAVSQAGGKSVKRIAVAHAMRTAVEPSEFCELLTSSRHLVRCDDGGDGTKALLDVETGEIFYVEETQLFGFALTSR